MLCIGDSRFVGPQMYARSGNADYFCDVGMLLFNYSSKVLSDDSFTNMTLQALLSNRSYDKLILSFGLNEAGYPKSFLISQYKSLFKMVQSLQPDAVLIINGIVVRWENRFLHRLQRVFR